MMNIGEGFQYDPAAIKIDQLNLADKWILTRLNETARTINKHFEGYFFSDATSAFQDFWVDCFCDKYLEYSKIVLKDQSRAHLTRTILFHIVETGLRLLHPMMTYLSEELYQKLPNWSGKSESICIAQFPLGDDAHIFQGVELFEKVSDIVTDIRKVLGTINLPPKSNPPVFIEVTSGDKTHTDLIPQFADYISSVTKVGEVKLLAAEEKAPKGSMSVLSSGSFTVHVDIVKFIKPEDEIKKIQKLISEKQKVIDSTKKKTEAKDYATKTPEEVRIKDKEKLDLLEAEIKTLQSNIDTFNKMLN